MFRVILVVTTYLLSSVGLLTMFGLIGEAIRQPRLTALDLFVMIVWPTAWGLHLVMSITWIKGKRLGRLWAIGGTLAGLASFFVWPAFFVSYPAPRLMEETEILTAINLMGIQFLLVSPCFLLAIWLVRFHWRTPASSGCPAQCA